MLAAASFEAYYDPDDRSRHLSDVAPNDCRITYTDESFFRNTCSGLVRFQLLEAPGAEEAPWPGSSTVLRLKVAASVARTTLDPGPGVLDSVKEAVVGTLDYKGVAAAVGLGPVQAGDGGGAGDGAEESSGGVEAAPARPEAAGSETSGWRRPGWGGGPSGSWAPGKGSDPARSSGRWGGSRDRGVGGGRAGSGTNDPDPERPPEKKRWYDPGLLVWKNGLLQRLLDGGRGPEGTSVGEPPEPATARRADTDDEGTPMDVLFVRNRGAMASLQLLQTRLGAKDLVLAEGQVLLADLLRGASELGGVEVEVELERAQVAPGERGGRGAAAAPPSSPRAPLRLVGLSASNGRPDGDGGAESRGDFGRGNPDGRGAPGRDDEPTGRRSSGDSAGWGWDSDSEDEWEGEPRGGGAKGALGESDAAPGPGEKTTVKVRVRYADADEVIAWDRSHGGTMSRGGSRAAGDGAPQRDPSATGDGGGVGAGEEAAIARALGGSVAPAATPPPGGFLGASPLGLLGPKFARCPWIGVRRKAGLLDGDVPRPVAFVECKDTGTEAWIGLHEASRTIVVAFRGTQGTEWRDILTDVSIVPASVRLDKLRRLPADSTLEELRDAGQSPVRSPAGPDGSPDCERGVDGSPGGARGDDGPAPPTSPSAAPPSAAEVAAESSVLDGAMEKLLQLMGDEPGRGIAENLMRAAQKALDDRGPRQASRRGPEVQDDGSTGGPVRGRTEDGDDSTLQGTENGEGPGGAPARRPSGDPLSEAWVHHGFLTAYESVRPALLQLIESQARSWEREDAGKSVLGGVFGSGLVPPFGGGAAVGGDPLDDPFGDIGDPFSGTGSEAPEPFFYRGGRSPPAEGGRNEVDRLGGWRVYVTGHSLGGALATLCASELSLRDWDHAGLASPPDVSLYTFGSPRVGNRAFAMWFDAHVPDAWRIVNGDDAVASVPRLMGYCHVGHAVALGADGEVRVTSSTEAQARSELSLPDALPAVSALAAALLPRLGSSALAIFDRWLAKVGTPEGRESGEGSRPGSDLSAGEIEALQGRLRGEWDAEVIAWKTILSLDTLQEHLEESYLEALQKAMDKVRDGRGRE